MGSPSAVSPVSPPSATQVAESFTAVYYHVASTLPARLPQLYGPDSALTHGPLVAQGSAIKAAAPRIPLAGRRVASVAHLAVQQIASGGYLVNVVGSYQLDDGKRSVFAQSFVLERQLHSHSEHFYCRNDLFVEMDHVVLPGKVPELKTAADDNHDVQKNDVQAEKEPPKQVVNNERDAQNAHPQVKIIQKTNRTPDTIQVEKRTSPAPVHQEQKIHDTTTVQSAVTTDQSSGTTDEQPEQAPIVTEKPDTQVNGVVEQAAVEKDVKHTGPETIKPDAPTVNKEQVDQKMPNGVVEEEPSVKSSPPTKKSWAAVVSTKDAAAAEQASKAASPQQKPASPGVRVKSRSASPEQATQNAQNSGQDTQVHPAQHGRHVQNGHAGHNGHHHRGGYGGGRGNYARRFGPSAVVHLSSLKPSQLQDPRQLSTDLKAEFSQYGHRLRHVEVKTQKGIAFIEYDTMDGVRAAVDMWARGARQEGAFAGIPLSVSEKHSYNKWRPNNMRGGGRGSVRGGGRRHNRPASTQIS